MTNYYTTKKEAITKVQDWIMDEKPLKEINMQLKFIYGFGEKLAFKIFKDVFERFAYFDGDEELVKYYNEEVKNYQNE
jgi:DNA-binding MltR family transcriptional regulator